MSEPRVGVLISRMRVEEKLLLEAFRERGVEPEQRGADSRSTLHEPSLGGEGVRLYPVLRVDPAQTAAVPPRHRASRPD